MDPGAERAFLDFVSRTTPDLFRIAYALTCQQQAAEDLLQTAFERVLVRWNRIDEPVGYAKRIIYNEYISWWRRWRRREYATDSLPDLADSGDHATRVVTRRVLAAALKTLSPGQRAVLVLRYLEDRSELETAEILGCSKKTVSSQTSRALAKLRSASGAFLNVRVGEEAS